jgi:hypothetical protein
MEAVKAFYNHHEGRSLINECLRMAIFQYFSRLLNNLEVREYHELFSLAKIYTVYIHIFANEEFNLSVKDLSMRYVKRLLKHYTDKRGKDYQDIKKFVSTTFQDLNFLKEKDVVELFKTRRKGLRRQGLISLPAFFVVETWPTCVDFLLKKIRLALFSGFTTTFFAWLKAFWKEWATMARPSITSASTGCGLTSFCPAYFAPSSASAS